MAVLGGGNTATIYSHSVASPVFKLGKAQLWAGSRFAINGSLIPFRLVVRLNGNAVMEQSAVAANSAAKRLLPDAVTKTPVRPEISIQWPDFSIPNLPLDWWEALVKAMAEIDGPIGLHCEGGHGRTGTALAIIFGLGKRMGLVTPTAHACVVDAIRDLYDGNAVESREQIRYIKSMGLDVTSLPLEDEWGGRYASYTTKPATGAEKPTQAIMDDTKPYGTRAYRAGDKDDSDLWEYDGKTWVYRAGGKSMPKTENRQHDKRKGKK